MHGRLQAPLACPVRRRGRVGGGARSAAKETIYRPLSPLAFEELTDDEEQPCGASRIEYVRATTTAQGRYWVLDQEGHLFSFDAAFEHRQAHLTNKKVDLLRRADDGSIWAVVNEEGRWRFLRRDEMGWHHLGDLPAMNRNDDAVGERQGRPALTTNLGETHWLDTSGLMHVWTGLPREGSSRGRLNRGQMTLASTSEGVLYVARDDGEFGGSLVRIDVGTTNRPTMQTEAFYGPMTDIAVDPTDRRCVFSSKGLVHGARDGRVVRSCPDGLSIVLDEKPMTEWKSPWTHEESEPFFRLVASGSTVYALGLNDNYAIGSNATRRLRGPNYTERCGQTVARVEGLMMMRVPALARKDLPYELLGRSLFAMPAL